MSKEAPSSQPQSNTKSKIRQIDEPISQIEEPISQIDEPISQIDEAISKIDEAKEDKNS
jgi:prefoldin subunit 5